MVANVRAMTMANWVSSTLDFAFALSASPLFSMVSERAAICVSRSPNVECIAGMACSAASRPIRAALMRVSAASMYLPTMGLVVASALRVSGLMGSPSSVVKAALKVAV